MKNIKKILVLVLFVTLTVSVTNAQEWNKEQAEVWKVVKDTWAGWKSGDATAVAASFHEKYQGWSDDSPLPMSKQSMMDWYNTMKDAMKISYYDIEPARIVVLKSSAVVDYYYYFNVSWDMGDDKGSKEVKGKIVEFYVKEGDKWLLLGDMMVHGDGDDEEDDD
jgi:hypothetical protein